MFQIFTVGNGRLSLVITTLDTEALEKNRINFPTLELFSAVYFPDY